MPVERTEKYSLNEKCDWCGHEPCRSYVIEKRGVKNKRTGIEVTACRECAERLQLVEG